jgi:hypothetical protein
VTAFSAAATDQTVVFDRYLSGVSDSVITEGNQRETLGSSVSVSHLGGNENGPGWKLNIGFGLTDYVAIEAGYLDLNDGSIDSLGNVADAASVSVPSRISDSLTHSADGFTLGSILHYNVSQHFDLSGTVGVFSWGSDGKTGSAPLGDAAAVDGNSGTDFYFGLGGGYQLFDDVTLSVEWEHYQLDSKETQVWSIGVDYHFK